VNTAIEAWTPRVGVERACTAFGVPPRTWRHRRQQAEGRLPPKPPAPPRERTPPPWTIPGSQRDRIRTILCEPRFCDLAPAQVFNTLLDEGVYLCSERTMYRILHEHDLIGERRRGHRRHHRYEMPRLQATAPNQVWSWDISRLRGPVLRSWFYLYVVIDIFSRKIVAWTIDTVESDKVARRLVHTACGREGIDADELTLHSDRGAQMTSTTLAELLEDLGVTRSLSRPRVSNDNPFSEANFKTAKYRPDYPARFDNIGQARAWMRRFAHWYNHVHYHSGIGHLHPADVHHGTAGDTVAARQNVLDRAYAANPERFRGQAPRAARPPAVAWINKPTIHTET